MPRWYKRIATLAVDVGGLALFVGLYAVVTLVLVIYLVPHCLGFHTKHCCALLVESPHREMCLDREVRNG
jgi:hypothetical protein